MMHAFVRLWVLALLPVRTVADGLAVAARRPAAARWSRRACGDLGSGTDLITRWGREVDASGPVLDRYPRPQMVRGLRGARTAAAFRDVGDERTWASLNGLWEWEKASDHAPVGRSSAAVGIPPFGRPLNGSILVPFPVESCLSGVPHTRAAEIPSNMWYRLTFSLAAQPNSSVLLHFGAVDWVTSVFFNRAFLGNHTGGYDGFSFDVTPHLRPDVDNELLVHVYDPTDLGPQPSGKQQRSAMDSPKGGTYTPSSGIWQTVWLEQVPASGYIRSIAIDQASLDTLTLEVDASKSGDVGVLVMDGSSTVAQAAGRTGEPLRIGLPGGARPWSPADPFLYDVQVTVGSDVVLSYAGLRTFALGQRGTAEEGHPLLNGAFTFMVGFLDQSFWPDGLYTAPTDQALEFDVQFVKNFGANLLRTHQKVNPERYYYHADRLGVAIFQDAVQKHNHAKNETVPHFVSDLTAMVRGRRNHPSILQWVAFNEGNCWGVFQTKPYDLPGIVDLVRSLDPTRLVDTDSGGKANDQHIGDVNDIHTYPYPHKPKPSATQYGMVGEWGGFGLFVPGTEWVPGKCFAYLQVDSAEAYAEKYCRAVEALAADVAEVSAAVYTQVTDVERECDGFLNYDRTAKFGPEQVARIRAAHADLISRRLPNSSSAELAALAAGGARSARTVGLPVEGLEYQNR